jgi:hypothetical protein
MDRTISFALRTYSNAPTSSPAATNFNIIVHATTIFLCKSLEKMQGLTTNRERGHTAFFIKGMYEYCEEVTWSRVNSDNVVTGLRAGKTLYKFSIPDENFLLLGVQTGCWAPSASYPIGT